MLGDEQWAGQERRRASDREISHWRGETEARTGTLEREVRDLTVRAQADEHLIGEMRVAMGRLETEVHELRLDLEHAMAIMDQGKGDVVSELRGEIQRGRVSRREWTVALTLVVIAPVVSSVIALLISAAH